MNKCSKVNIVIIIFVALISIATTLIIVGINQNKSIDQSDDFCYNRCIDLNMSKVGYSSEGLDMKCVCYDKNLDALVVSSVFKNNIQSSKLNDLNINNFSK